MTTAFGLFATLAERDLRIHLASSAVKRYGNGVAGPLVVQHQAEVELACSFLAIDRDDHIASDEDSAHPEQGGVLSSTQACFVRPSAARGALNEQALLHRQIERLGQPRRQRQGFHAKDRLVHAAVGPQIVSDQFGGGGGGGGTQGRGGFTRGGDGGVDGGRLF